MSFGFYYNFKSAVIQIKQEILFQDHERFVMNLHFPVPNNSLFSIISLQNAVDDRVKRYIGYMD